MPLIDTDHRFFRSRWRRIAVVATCLFWAVMEFALGAPHWGLFVGVIGLYAGWVLLVAYPKDDSSGS